MKKKIIAVLLTAIMPFAFAACNAETEDKSVSELQQQIAELQEENLKLQDRIEQLEKFEGNYLLKNYCFITLQEAYDNGLINREDIMHISYYYQNNMVFEVVDGNLALNDSNMKQIDFSPKKELSTLNSNVENAIKLNFYRQNIDMFKEYESIDNLSVQFLGEYNANYVVVVDCDNWGYGAVITFVDFGGIVLLLSGAPIRVFCLKG